MGWRLWQRHKVRPADIPPELRERFEFYGESLLTLASAIEPDEHVLGMELAGLSRLKRQEIAAWLQERREIETIDRKATLRWARIAAWGAIAAVLIGIATIIAIILLAIPPMKLI